MKTTLSESEQFIVEHIKSHFGLVLNKIQESVMPSPDFELIENGKRSFVIELKDIEYVEASEETGWTICDHPDGIQTKERTNNSVSRVGKKICDAFKQLERFDEPKGVVFLNTDTRTRCKHLDEAMLGCEEYSNGHISYKNTAANRISSGKLSEVKERIDFFIWVERETGQHFFRYVTDTGQAILKKYFKMV